MARRKRKFTTKDNEPSQKIPRSVHWMSLRKHTLIARDSEQSRKKSRSAYGISNMATGSATRHAACDAVFLTTELLENILAHLPMKDLLLSQRVCRKWKAVITSSNELQQALFFVPKKAPFRWKFEWSSVPKITRVPQGTPLTRRSPGQFSVFEAGYFNPLLFQHFRTSDTILGVANEGSDNFALLKDLATSYPDGSWRTMLATQPPVKHIDYYNQYHDISHSIDNANGITGWDTVKDAVSSRLRKRAWLKLLDGHCFVIDDFIFATGAEMYMTDESLKQLRMTKCELVQFLRNSNQ